MKKKILSIMLAGAMAVSMTAVGALSAGAEEASDKAPGDYGSLGEYTATAGVQTNRLMFAMPGAWQNDTTKNEKCGGAAGIYWWSGYDTPDNKAGGHGWPGYKAKKVAEEGVDNLFEINVPTYGNGETGNATQIIWNNYIDGGTETDANKNPFYDAAAQIRDFPGQYYSRGDGNANYEPLFRYIYKSQLVKAGVDVAAVDEASETFWEDLNKAAAASLGKNWDTLKANEKTFQIDEVLDGEDLDFSEFGEYAGNFFNEDLVGEDIFPKEESNMLGISFLFSNMVFVVNFDPAKMIPSPVSGKIGFDGDFYFYYGKGEYGTWPTKELNTAKGGVLGSFISEEYLNTKMSDLSIPTVATTAAPTTIPAASSDAKSSTNDTASGSTTSNNSNGAVATGEFSLIAIVLVVITAGVGFAIFARRKERK